MTYTVVLISIICLGLGLAGLENRRTSGRQLREQLRGSYGKIPAQGDVDFSLLEYSWIFEREGVSYNEQIDDITWDAPHRLHD